MGDTRYRIKVHNLECCNCNHGCGCQFNGYPDRGGCEAILGYEVIDGYCGEVDLKGARAVFGVKWPKAIHEGNGAAVMFVDESTPQEQVDGLVQIFSGQLGGMPWEALAATLTSFEGPIRKPVQLTANGRHSSIRVDGIVEAEFAPIRNPVTEQDQEVNIVYPKGGFIWDEGLVGTTKKMQIKYGENFNFEYPGWFAAYATPTWTNEA